MSQLYFCQMIQNRRWEGKICIDRVLPYVDKIILVDGGSVDDSIIYFRNLEKEEPKLNFYISPWRDNFPAQRNKYLEKVPEGNWVIVSDPDELFYGETCKEFRRLADEAEKSNLEWNGYAFRAHDVSLRGEKVVWESKPENSRKPLMFWKYGNGVEDTHYLEERNPHEQLVCRQGYRYKNTELFYSHLKQDTVTWVRGCRNFFIGGGGPNLGTSNPIWMPFRGLIKRKTNITKWDEFNSYLIRGRVNEDILKWMYQYSAEGKRKGDQEKDGDSEIREVAKTYFLCYHPEELEVNKLPEEIRENYVNYFKKQ